ncbi:hypothetical protein [Nocardia caishijiensis]|uniref:Secreted protein n=1 Tax=Nocardia caishijiensis TaxID=184756 RepID=A0ABQ6YI91_9NOCA|nr:hypothetical protein [Nocardia caishijiensis]KAF0845300.1 hypothetical protein FNL39_108108 [Nocardia caishijiensis]
MSEVSFTKPVAAAGKVAVTVVAAAMLTLAVSTIAPSVAQAATHRVDLSEACKQQYGKQSVKLRHVDDVQQQVTTPGSRSADEYHNPNRATPYGYYCVETTMSKSLSIPPGIEGQVIEQELGDLDVQAYCDRNHPGTTARGNFDADKTWDCV